MLQRYSSPMYLSHTIYNLRTITNSMLHTESMANFLAWFHFLDFNLTYVYLRHLMEVTLHTLEIDASGCSVICILHWRNVKAYYLQFIQRLKMTHARFSPYSTAREPQTIGENWYIYWLEQRNCNSQGNILIIKPVYTSCLKVYATVCFHVTTTQINVRKHEWKIKLSNFG